MTVARSQITITEEMRGRGIMSVIRHFGLSSSPTTEPTGYDPTPKTPTNTSRYLWAYDRITYDDGTTVDTRHAVAGVYGGDGHDGKTSYIHIAYSNSADGVKDFSTSISAGKLYVGMYVDFNASASGNPGSYKWQAVGGADIRHEVDKLVSRGDQLVVNGNASMGDNTNFPALTYDGKERCGGSASFTRPLGSGQYFPSAKELIPVDSGAEYEFSFDAKSLSSKATMYSYLQFHDIDGNWIKTNHVMFIQGTTTELAKDLKDGDTVVYLKNVTEAWKKSVQTYQFGLVFWNYKDSRGYQYPVETYSRNVFSNLFAGPSSVNTEANTITLSSPWSGGTIAKGTPLSQRNEGGFSYVCLRGHTVPTEWIHYHARYKDLGILSENLTANIYPGAAFMKFAFLWNYNSAPDDQVWVSNISLRKVNKGDKGDKGEAAYTVMCAPAAAVFNTDENGNLLADVSVTVKVKQGAQDINVNGKVSTVGAVNFTKGEARVNGDTITLNKAGVARQAVLTNGVSTTLPCTSGSVDLQIAIDATTKLTYTIPFSVNVNRFLASTYSDLKGFRREFTEFKGNATSMTNFKSEVLQSARTFSVELTEKALSNQNLLVNSELKTAGAIQIRWLQEGTCIAKNKGYNGTNALRVKIAGQTENRFLGMFWNGSALIKYPGPGKYTLSLMACSPNPSAVDNAPYVEAHIWDNPQGKRQIQVGGGSLSGLTTAYKLFAVTFDVPAGKGDYLEICIFSLRNGEVSFSRPCLTKTDSYVGWSRHKDDKDYIGGNLIRGSQKFDGDFTINGTKAENGYEQFTTVDMTGALYCNLPAKSLGTYKDYMLSFWIKSNGNLTVRLRNPLSDNTDTCLLTENSDGSFDDAAGGKSGASVLAKREAFTRVWVHFRTNGCIADNMQIVFSKNSETAASVYGLKLEEGAEMTDWTDDVSLVSSSLTDIKTLVRQTSREITQSVYRGLKRVGIDINAKLIDLVSDMVGFTGTDGKRYITIERDEIGMPHFIFLAPDGVTKMYDLGYSGIKSLISEAVPAKFSEVSLIDITSLPNESNNILHPGSAAKWYQFLCSYSIANGKTLFGDGEEYNNMYFGHGYKTYLNNPSGLINEKKANGYFVSAAFGHENHFKIMNPEAWGSDPLKVTSQFSIFYIKAGKLTKTIYKYITALYKRVNYVNEKGKETFRYDLTDIYRSLEDGSRAILCNYLWDDATNEQSFI